MSADCIFCKIAGGDVPAKIACRKSGIVAIEDIAPQAPRHLVVFPVEHSANVAELARRDASAVERLFSVAAELGAQCGAGGFRLVVNSGPDGGQTVDHVHAHVLAGRAMGWPPG